jgi:hypothetical protein
MFRAFAVKGGTLYKNHGGITRANMRIYLAREIRCRVRLLPWKSAWRAPKSHCRRSIESKATDTPTVMTRSHIHAQHHRAKTPSPTAERDQDAEPSSACGPRMIVFPLLPLLVA